MACSGTALPLYLYLFACFGCSLNTGVGKGQMEENCGGGQGLNWAVVPRRERVVALLLLTESHKFRSELTI
jgi:hypothetical protein